MALLKFSGIRELSVGRGEEPYIFVLLLLMSTFIAFWSNVACVIHAFYNLVILYLWLKHAQLFFFLMFHGFLAKDIILVCRVSCFIHLVQSATEIFHMLTFVY